MGEFTSEGIIEGLGCVTSSIAILLGFTSFNPAYTGNFSGDFFLGDLLIPNESVEVNVVA